MWDECIEIMQGKSNIMEPLKVKETGLAEGIPSIKHANKVEHPSHYADGRKYEPINVICDWNLDFCLGNVVKYISRAGRKENEIEDLKKARFYLDYKIKEMEGV